MVKQKIGIFFCLCLLFGVAVVQGEEKNILGNPGFEQEKSPEPWQHFHPKDQPLPADKNFCRITDKQFHSGRYSCEVNGINPEVKYPYIHQTFKISNEGPINSGKIYKVSFWIKTDLDPDKSAHILLEQYDKEGKSVSGEALPEELKADAHQRGKSDWTLKWNYVNISPQTDSLIVRVLTFKAIGTAWFDDFVMEEIKISKK